jgi:hypothetical protein
VSARSRRCRRWPGQSIAVAVMPASAEPALRQGDERPSSENVDDYPMITCNIQADR